MKCVIGTGRLLYSLGVKPNSRANARVNPSTLSNPSAMASSVIWHFSLFKRFAASVKRSRRIYSAGDTPVNSRNSRWAYHGEKFAVFASSERDISSATCDEI